MNRNVCACVSLVIFIVLMYIVGLSLIISGANFAYKSMKVYNTYAKLEELTCTAEKVVVNQGKSNVTWFIPKTCGNFTEQSLYTYETIHENQTYTCWVSNCYCYNSQPKCTEEYLAYDPYHVYLSEPKSNEGSVIIISILWLGFGFVFLMSAISMTWLVCNRSKQRQTAYVPV